MEIKRRIFYDVMWRQLPKNYSHEESRSSPSLQLYKNDLVSIVSRVVRVNLKDCCNVITVLGTSDSRTKNWAMSIDEQNFQVFWHVTITNDDVYHRLVETKRVRDVSRPKQLTIIIYFRPYSYSRIEKVNDQSTSHDSPRGYR